jgi:hypothetical protein
MKCKPPNNAFSILFDLASTLAVPRISKHINKLMWPVLTPDEQDELTDLATKISHLRSFECEHERWPFQGGSDKVASVVKTIAATEDGDSNWKQRAICYTREYYLELSFQRFFAWIVHQSAGDITGSETHFHYRNAYANARSVLAMPLLVDLARQTGVAVGQGNFGYKPARSLPWIYPHLSHYLSAFYYPWIPNVGLDKAEADAALDRAITRSRHVSLELFKLLSEGSALRMGFSKQHLEEGVAALFATSGISPFVRSAIISTGFIDLCKMLQDFHEEFPQFEMQILNDDVMNRAVAQYLEVDLGRRERSVHEKLIQTCRQNLNTALRHELDRRDGEDFFMLNETKLKEFLKWRYFEERIRLAVDRLLLERRFLDPPLTRSRFSAKFENLGLFGVEVPEIQFNLYLEDFNRFGTSYKKDITPRSETCREWIHEARRRYKNDGNKMGGQGSFPFHALFETYLMETDPENRLGPFWMALLLSHIVPSIDPNDKKAKRGREAFLVHAKNRMKEWAALKPFAPLTIILHQKREEKLNPHYGEDCNLWLWLEEKLDQLCRQQVKACWQDVTFKQLLEEILTNTNQTWVDPGTQIECAMRQVLRGRTLEGADLTAEERRELQTLLRVEKETREREERGRRFFSYASFFGVNTTIFRALTDLNYARNFLTIRLIATERSSTSASAGSSLESQDHADFVGSYVVWQRDENNELVQQSPHNAYVPRLDAWREEQATNISSHDGLQANSLTELHNLKSVIKNLGISLLNQERIKEQERLNTLVRRETTRSTIAGIMARNMSHNIGSHVLASSGLLQGVDMSEIEKLHNFLQQRMDFIAQVVTYTPSWGEPMFFFKDLLGEFFNQYLLLDNLIKDQGYPEITFVVKVEKSKQESDRPEQEFVFERKRVCAKCKAVVRDKNERCDCPDFDPRSMRITGSWQLTSGSEDSLSAEEFLVAIPGGSIGAHAFYVIVENMLRNSAKYGVQQKQKVGLQFHISVIEKDDRYWIKVWDNTGERTAHDSEDPKSCQCPVCIVQRRLSDELIDPETGAVTEKSRGIHEMKECATILVSPHLEEFGKLRGGKRVALWADAETHNKTEYLQYSFILQKPRLVGIVDTSGETSSAARSAGVFSYTDIENLARYPHQLGLIYLRTESREYVVNYLNEHHYLLPYRLLLIDKTGLGPMGINVPRRVEWCQFNVPNSKDRSVWQRFVIELWEIWLQRFKQPGQTWKMLISFDRPAGHTAFVRWGKALESFKSPLVEVYLGRSKDRTFGAMEFPKEMSYQKFRSELEGSESSWVVFDNHRASLKDPGTEEMFVNLEDLAAYQEFGAKYNIRLFQTLESPPTSEFGFHLFLLGLLESSLMKVVIVDERLADAVYDKEVGFGNGLVDLLRNANCFPIFSVWSEQNGAMIRRFVSETIGQRSEETNKPGWEGVNREEGLYLSEDPYVGTHVPAVTKSSKVEKFGKDDAVDTIIIHQGVIDVLHQNNLWQGEDHNDYHLELLHKLSPSIIITSGRGRTIRHVKNKEIPFVEFSIIKDNTYAGLSKYHLVRSILSVAGEKRELNTHE